MMRALVLAALVSLGLAAGPALAQQDEIASDATEGASVGQEIVLLGYDGGLVALDLKTNALRTLFEHGVSDILKADNRLWIIRNPAPVIPPPDASDEEIEQAYDAPWARVEVASYADGKFGASFSVDLEGNEKPYLMVLIDGAPALLSETTLRVRSGDRWVKTVLSEPIDGGPGAVAITGDGKTIYAGANFGEWGGGLQAINVATGHVRRIEKGDEETGCRDGPLYTACDPVTAVLADAERPGCVYVGIGLQHFFSHGRVLRVCSDDIEVVFEKEIVLPPPPPGEEWVGGGGKEAVYGLAWSGKDLLILTSEGLHRIHAGRTESVSLPDLEEKAGILFTDRLPGLYVVASGANQRFSVSGLSPLLIQHD